MRIALIADTFSVERGTGIARYSEALRSGLAAHGMAVQTICPQPPTVPFGLAINHALKMPYAVRSKAAGFDIIHATSPITALAFPIVQRPKVVTYLDLLSLLCDETSSAAHTRLFAPLFLRIGKFADRIIAISSQTKQELTQYLGLPAEKIVVVNLGIAEAFRPRPRMKTGHHVIGYVGALNRRKALPHLLRAVLILKVSHPELWARLVICGEKKHEYDALARLTRELGLEQIVEFRGSLTDQELVEAYNSFDVFVLPSEWEGFGLPILEAQRCGVPVVIREDAHIPREVQECCLKAASEQDMASKIYELLTNSNLRQPTIEQGLEHSRRFTWENTIRKTLQVYEQALS
jgi:glycosyltransferase involved in cell wall biosynthesis